MTKHEAVFTKDLENKKVTVVRSFIAPLESVWEAWTTGEILDQWWGPKPYKVETKSMDFKEGGEWNYLMKGPDGYSQWCRAVYTAISPLASISSYDVFCDKDGKEDKDFPRLYWQLQFAQAGNETTVNVHLSCDTKAGMEKIINTGFEQGFTAGLNNLEEYLAGK